MDTTGVNDVNEFRSGVQGGNGEDFATAGDRSSTRSSQDTRDLTSGGLSTSRGSHLPQTAAGKMREAAAALRERSTTGEESRLTRFAGTAASRIEGAASYVEGASFDGLRTDAGGVIRRYPLQSLAVGFGLGLLTARMISRR